MAQVKGLTHTTSHTTAQHKLTLSALVLALSGLASAAVHADQLADIQKAGVVKVATFDANPPFGSIDAKTHDIVGYDVDFAKALAKSLGVKLELVATNPANRIPLLQSGKVDLIVADITITPERAQVVDFSTPYFVTGQQFLVPASGPDKLEDYAKGRVGAVKGTTGEQALVQRFPSIRVLSYDDIPLAFTALRNGNVQAITQDSTILAGLLAEAPDKAKFKILPDLLSKEEIGVGVKKGEPALLKAVNDELVKLEQHGQAEQIYNAWFGPDSKTPQPRSFKIVAK
jgi:polar amino acid transport system substrate-binding protein